MSKPVLSNKAESGLVICNHGHYATVENQHQEHFKCTFRRKLGMLVAGDKVSWQQTDDHGGDIIKLEPRHSEFARLDRRLRPKILASNINHIVIVSAVLPEPDTLLIDSYIAAANNLNCEVTLLFNKIDLLDSIAEPEHYHTLKSLYEDLGYNTLELSCKQSASREALLAIFKERCSILVGQSGVGKSSLTNILIPDLELRTQEISDNTLKGTHTTTNATLYHLDKDAIHAGDIIDSPGVREYRFQPKNLQEIAHGFIEFKEYIPECKFNNCKHLNDKGCAVIAALQAGKIEQSRWNSYANLVEQFEEQQKQY